MPNTTPYKIVGIAGGKRKRQDDALSTLAEELGTRKTTVISCDNYYHPLDHLSLEERAGINFDHPDSIDFSLLADHLASIRQGNSIKVPKYCFATHTRLPNEMEVRAKPVILVEGILLFSSEALQESFDLRVFVVADATVRFERRMARDTNQRGRTRESVLTQWQNSVERMFTEHVQPTRDGCDVEVDASGPIEDSAMQSLVNQIAKL